LIYIGVTFFKRYKKILKTRKVTATLDALIQSATSRIQYYEFKIYLILKFFDFVKFKHIKSLLDFLTRHLLKSEYHGFEPANSLFAYATNPVKLALMLIHLLGETEKSFSATKFTC